MADPLLHDARVEYVVAAIAAHSPARDSPPFRCASGDWQAPEHGTDCGHLDAEQCAESDVFEWERHRADAILAALHDAGVLLPPGVVVVATTEAAAGFAERVEWGSLDGGVVVTWGVGGEKQARANAKWLRETDPDAKVMCRRAYIGQWEPVTEEGTGRG